MISVDRAEGRVPAQEGGDMITGVAQALTILFGARLVFAGLLMAARPQTALHYLGRAASTKLVNFPEITFRLISGFALVVLAEHSKFQELPRIARYFLAATPLLLCFVPRASHHRYAFWWSRKLTPVDLRVAAPVSLAAGAFVIYAAV